MLKFKGKVVTAKRKREIGINGERSMLNAQRSAWNDETFGGSPPHPQPLLPPSDGGEGSKNPRGRLCYPELKN